MEQDHKAQNLVTVFITLVAKNFAESHLLRGQHHVQ